MELRHFTTWLQAECLDAEWRLKAYSKILDICKVEGAGIRLETLCKMLPEHTEKSGWMFRQTNRWNRR